jgi:hypothetical protein
MGRYAIVIVATGSNHNTDHHGDADRMAHQFCNKLREAGHNIESAEFQLIGPNSPEPLLEGVPTTGVFQQQVPAQTPPPAAETKSEDAPPKSE